MSQTVDDFSELMDVLGDLGLMQETGYYIFRRVDTRWFKSLIPGEEESWPTSFERIFMEGEERIDLDKDVHILFTYDAHRQIEFDFKIEKSILSIWGNPIKIPKIVDRILASIDRTGSERMDSKGIDYWKNFRRNTGISGVCGVVLGGCCNIVSGSTGSIIGGYHNSSICSAPNPKLKLEE